MLVTYADIARRFLAHEYPNARVALIGGSTARGERTATSDIDLLVLGDALFPEGRSSQAATFRFEDEVLEVFAYTPAGFEVWAERGAARHRPVIVDMLLYGLPIRDDGSLAAMRERWQPVHDAGPVLDATESLFRRYVITDLLDDLRDATDPVERHVVASALFERIGELILLTEGRWIGTGKWLPRRLRELSVLRADALSEPLLARDHALFFARVEAELTRAGGRVQDGFER